MQMTYTREKSGILPPTDMGKRCGRNFRRVLFATASARDFIAPAVSDQIEFEEKSKPDDKGLITEILLLFIFLHFLAFDVGLYF